MRKESLKIRFFIVLSSFPGGVKMVLPVTIIISILLGSCSNIKYLKKDEYLYTYTWYSEKGAGKIKNKPLKLYEFYNIGTAKTNRPFIFLPRMNLYFYYHCKPKGNWGFRHYVYRVFAKPPVLLRDVNPDLRLKVMKQKLFDFGHFDSDINLNLKYYGRNDKKVRAKYKIFFKPAYTYRNLEVIKKGTPVDSLIASSMKNSLIIPGNDYWLKELEDERFRISLLLKNDGYFFFNPEYLLFTVDSTAGKKQVDLKLLIKEKVPQKAFEKYTVGKINILVKSNKNNYSSKVFADSVFLDKCFYRSEENTFRPEVITKAITIKPGSYYKYKDHENTLRYLQGMGAFGTVDVSFEEASGKDKTLNAKITLVPSKPVEASMEVNFATKSNDFLGPAAIVSLGHSNIFKGAEKLVLQVDGGFEWQKRSIRKEYELGLNSYEVGMQLKLNFPRFVTPFTIEKRSPRYVPKTYTGVGIRSLKRVKYYTMNLSQINFGYYWRTSPKREYKLEPVSINYLRLTQRSIEFLDFLNKYPQVATSFEEQLIIGSNFSYTYHKIPGRNERNEYYYYGKLDVSGNVLNAVYEIGNLKKEGEQGQLFGTPYAQYFKITNDLRYYYRIGSKSLIAMRLLGGIGVPFQNSTVLPYVKQYFVGGSQDVRAFYARTVGPGSYHVENENDGRLFLDQSGEIKLEGNMEYRFPLTYKTFGALFVDAGNVWLLKDDPSRPGGKFEFSKFTNQFAIGAGTGIRIDITFFVLRLDVAFPLRKPYLPSDKRWIFNNTGFLSDFVISFAVGYPF